MTATEFKNRAAEVLKEVAASGEPVLVTRRGKPLARVEPVDEPQKTVVLGALRASCEILGDLVEPVFDEWDTLAPPPARPRKRSR